MRSTRREFLNLCTAAVGSAASTAAIGAAGTNPAVSAEMNQTASQISSAENSESEVGKPYVGWKEGEMDLHFILTGIGESMFHIYPDGTTMLVDAADRPKSFPVYPDETRLASEWIMRYLNRVNPSGRKIDFMMLSHYHADHAGCERASAGKTKGRGEDYFLSGLANIGEHFQFTKVFDRGFPTYDQPKRIVSDGFTNFVAFTKYMLSEGRFEMEEFEVGKENQIGLCKTPEKFPEFRTRNICRNGVFWTGKGSETINFYQENPKNLNRVNENTLSLGLLIEYGPFRYFTGGDLSLNLLDRDGKTFNSEGYAGRVLGQLDVCKTNHHSYKDSMPPEFTNAVQAKVYVSNVWSKGHLQNNTMTNMAESAEDVLVCPTAIYPGVLEDEFAGCSWIKNLAKESREGGHVVVKVFDGGKQYKIYYLTAKDESMNVRQVYGPFTSKRA